MNECLDENWQLIACPGGMPGATNLRDSPALTTLLRRQYDESKLIGAICASPAVILAHHNLLGSKQATCYPAGKFTSAIPHYSDTASVIVDGNLVTSQGPGTSLSFSIKLVELLFGEEKAQQIKKEMIA